MGAICYIFLLICLTPAFADNCQTPQLIKIKGEPYILKSLFITDKLIDAPQSIMTSEGEILYNTGKNSFSMKNAKEEKLKFHVPMKTRKSYIYPSGEDVFIQNGKILLARGSRDKTVRLHTKVDYQAHNLAVDSEENRLFFLVFPLAKLNMPILGRVYVYDVRDAMNEIGGMIPLSEITGLGHNVTALAVDRKSGNLIMSVTDINPDGKHFWSFKELDKIDKSPPRKEDSNGFNKQALESAIKQASKQIIHLYEEAVMGANTKVAENPVNKVMECKDKLQKSENNLNKSISTLSVIRSNTETVKNTIISILKKDVSQTVIDSFKTVFEHLDVVVSATNALTEIQNEIEKEEDIDVRFQKAE